MKESPRYAQRKQAMLTNSKIALSIAVVLATASAAAAAPHKHAVRHQTATARHLPTASYLGTSSARFSGSVNESCYFKIQDIGNEDSNGFTPTDYNCRQAPGRS
jgi:hypothetical protein